MGKRVLGIKCLLNLSLQLLFETFLTLANTYLLILDMYAVTCKVFVIVILF